jgi:heme oxygenase
MKPGLLGQSLSLMEELKAASFAAHARLQTAPFFAALAACQLPLESYVGQLRALALIHSQLEQTLAECSDARVASIWSDDRRKVPLLLQDLRYFEPRRVADLKEAATAALQADTQIRLWSIEQPLALLACLYVLEGSTLGAAVLRPLVARALLLATDDGQAYLTSYGPAVHSRWKQFQQGMNTLQLSAVEREQMAQAANDFFKLLESVFLALYPFKPESKTFLVSSIRGHSP